MFNELDAINAGTHFKRHTEIDTVKFSDMVVIEDQIPDSVKHTPTATRKVLTGAKTIIKETVKVPTAIIKTLKKPLKSVKDIKDPEAKKELA